jgi:cytochrome c-L
MNRDWPTARWAPICSLAVLLMTSGSVEHAHAQATEPAAQAAEPAAQATEPAPAPPEFRHALDDAPLEIVLPEGDDLTEAVERFHQTGENIYVDDADAIVVGGKLYKKYCQACHLPDATGRIGPNLVDEEFVYPRTETDVGLFEVIHGGAAGAMQAFGNRLSQDEILQVIAFVRSLRAP